MYEKHGKQAEHLHKCIQFRCSDRTFDTLSDLAEQSNTAKSQLVRIAVALFLNQKRSNIQEGT